MINSLTIQNYALIRQLNIEPNKGLNIITGETGAGKSIMLGAVGLLLGNRADTKALLDKEKKCVIEGEFEISSLGLFEFFESEDLDYEDLSIIRREINPKGKSRAFINDIPVTLDILKSVGNKLMDIHSQNESAQLAGKVVKLKLVDDYAQSEEALKLFQQAFLRYNGIVKKLGELNEQEKDSKTDADYKSFLLEELVNAELKIGEQHALEEEQKVLENAEEIKQSLTQVTVEFDEAEISIIDKLKEAVSVLRKLSQFSENLEKLGERFESSTAELVDIIHDLQVEKDHIEFDSERTEVVNARLDLINRLQLKHKVQSIDELIAIQSDLEKNSSSVLDLEETIKKLVVEKDSANKVMIREAEKLSEIRRKNIDVFSHALNQLLAEVGMPDGQVDIIYKRVEPWKMGIDEVELLFTANKGIKPEPIGNVASGGEFSRLMFCIKFLLADKTAMPTVIFDEIDTGVSGEIAIKLAGMMKKMATNHQIIAISHLPQVAAKGEAHYYVYKNNHAEKTESLIKELSETDRLEEIAKMIGGDQPSETAINSARELITKN
ncbi:MAG: DNA repair protein RecN [Reichenbachiella sp.]